ncbi:hypothetical protein [Nonomuraea rosea]|uniref:hypothetical protein n=1 Tax=Nonomuraea rosea TaxID=638574 RepID=UPI0031EB8A69
MTPRLPSVRTGAAPFGHMGITGPVPTVRRHRTVGHGVSGGALVTTTGAMAATLTKTATIESLMVTSVAERQGDQGDGQATGPTTWPGSRR